MKSSYRHLSANYRALKKAKTYQQWFCAAQEIDTLEGHSRWRGNDESGYYPFELLQEQIDLLTQYREEHRVGCLISYMQESLHRTLGELTDSHLYDTSLVGTKYLVEQYLDEVEETLNYLCDAELDIIDEEKKLKLFKHARNNFGRSALMLSGGGAFGIYHLGIIKALLEQNLLPSVISGTSMGAIVTGLVGTHSDAELLEKLSVPEDNDFSPIKHRSLMEVFSKKSLLESEQLLQCISNNIPNDTFLEAYLRTGRAINITVSPTRAGQKARVLNYKTAPNVLVAYACKASCSIPGVFPAVQLRGKNAEGDIVPYMESELWADGGVSTDIPMARIGRIFNANHFIVSQTNPHVLPFVANRSKKGVLPFVIDFASSSIHAQWHQVITVTKKHTQNRTLRFWLDRADALLGQDYLGDINLHPEFPIKKYLKVMTNPSDDEIYDFILTGERSTWPNIAMIRNQTRISRVLARCYEKCYAKHHGHTHRSESIGKNTFVDIDGAVPGDEIESSVSVRETSLA